MKKILSALFLMTIVLTMAVPVMAETTIILPDATIAPVAVVAEPEPTPTTPWTWAYLATIAGATAATLLIVQFFKVPLDHVWKIPTRLFVYIIAFVILTVATGFTTGLDANTFLLCILNSFIVALAAYGAYEVTFAKMNM